MKCNKKAIPMDKRLYNSIKTKIKNRSKVWPSAYASGQLVRVYKSKGGRYRCTAFGNLDRWFKERWVDVCRPKEKGYKSCGRKKSSWGNYPYCRPLKRINSKTPRTVGEMSKSALKRLCRQKRKNPRKKVFNFGEKKYRELLTDHTMNREVCGFGKKRNVYKENRRQLVCGFGEGGNLGPTTSNLDTFYKNGTANSSNLTKDISGCLAGNYNFRFGKKPVKFIQQANEQSKRKGTVGSFTRWCKRQGYPKVTTKCIELGKKNRSLKIRRRAIFAQNIRSKKRNYRFGSDDDDELIHSKYTPLDIEKFLNIWKKTPLPELRNEYENSINDLKRYTSHTHVYAQDYVDGYKRTIVDTIYQVLRERNAVPKIQNEFRKSKGYAAWKYHPERLNNQGYFNAKREPGIFNFGKHKSTTSDIKYLKSLK